MLIVLFYRCKKTRCLDSVSSVTLDGMELRCFQSNVMKQKNIWNLNGNISRISSRKYCPSRENSSLVYEIEKFYLTNNFIKSVCLNLQCFMWWFSWQTQSQFSSSKVIVEVINWNPRLAFIQIKFLVVIFTFIHLKKFEIMLILRLLLILKELMLVSFYIFIFFHYIVWTNPLFRV